METVRGSVVARVRSEGRGMTRKGMRTVRAVEVLSLHDTVNMDAASGICPNRSNAQPWKCMLMRAMDLGDNHTSTQLHRL